MSNYLLIYLLIDLFRDYLLMQQMPSNKVQVSRHYSVVVSGWWYWSHVTGFNLTWLFKHCIINQLSNQWWLFHPCLDL